MSPQGPFSIKIRGQRFLTVFKTEVLRKAIDDLSIKIDKLNSSENDLQQHISTARQQLLNVTSSSSTVATSIVKELEDKERRKNNLIFYNVPEPSTPS